MAVVVAVVVVLVVVVDVVAVVHMFVVVVVVVAFSTLRKLPLFNLGSKLHEEQNDCNTFSRQLHLYLSGKQPAVARTANNLAKHPL